MTDTASLALTIAEFEARYPFHTWIVNVAGALVMHEFDVVASTFGGEPAAALRKCMRQMDEAAERASATSRYAEALAAEYGPRITD